MTAAPARAVPPATRPIFTDCDEASTEATAAPTPATIPTEGATTLAEVDGLMTIGTSTDGPSAGGPTSISNCPSFLSSRNSAYISTGITSYLDANGSFASPMRVTPSGTDTVSSVPSGGGCA